MTTSADRPVGPRSTLDKAIARTVHALLADLADYTEPGEQWLVELLPGDGIRERHVTLSVRRDTDFSTILTLDEIVSTGSIDLGFTKSLVLGGWTVTRLSSGGRTVNAVLDPEANGAEAARRMLGGLEAVDALSPDWSLRFSPAAQVRAETATTLTRKQDGTFLLRSGSPEDSDHDARTTPRLEEAGWVSDDVAARIDAVVRSARHWASSESRNRPSVDLSTTEDAWLQAANWLKYLGRWPNWNSAAVALSQADVPAAVADAALLWIAAELCDGIWTEQGTPSAEMIAALRGPWEHLTAEVTQASEGDSDDTVASDPEGIRDDLIAVATWLTLQGRADDLLFPALSSIPPGLPKHVAEAVRRLMALRGSDLVSPGDTIPTPAAVLDFVIGQLDARELDILKGRVLAKAPETLDAIGDRFGVTRERIRQLEARLRVTCSEWMTDPDLLEPHITGLRSAVGELCALDQVLDRVPGLRDDVTSVDLPAWNVLDKLDVEIESDGVWVASPSLAAVRSATLELVQTFALPSRAIAADAVTAVLTRFENLHDENEAERWLLAVGCSQLAGAWVLPGVTALGDRLAIALESHGEPVSVEFASSHWFPELSARYLSNVLGSDDRFRRVDRDQWGLSEWGFETYTTIADAIKAELLNRGPLPLADLVEAITARFDVSPRSVIAYANAYPFMTERGVVRIAYLDPRTNRTLTRTRNLYAVDNGVQYRFLVNAEHLRGSGWPIPVALAAHLGVGRDEPTRLPSNIPGWSFSATWRSHQPTAGSIRTPLMTLNAAVGDTITLRFENRHVSVGLVSPSTKSASALVAALVGLPVAEPLTWSLLARALELPDSADRTAALEVIRTRGEADLAELLTSIPELAH